MLARRRRTCLSAPALAVLLALLTGCATIAHAATAGGGLSVNPAIIDHVATPGDVGTIAIVNTTTTAQKITITPRPWISSPTGVVTPNPHKDLTALVSISQPSFTLTAGASRSVTVTLRKPAPGGSLFASIVAVSVPVDAAKRPGITLGFRFVTRLRLDPAQDARKLKVTVGAPRIVGKNIVLPIRNTGNTIEPIGGGALVTGPSGARNVAFIETRILPGATVQMGVAPVSEFKRGRYTINYTVQQTGTRVAAGKKTIQIS